MEMDRVRVAREVDDLPDLVLAERRKEGGGVLEVRGDRAVADRLLAFAESEERSAVVVARDLELAHGEHVWLVVELSLDERDRAAHCGGQGIRRRWPMVRG